MSKPLRILVVTNNYPMPQSPASGTYVEQQIRGLEQIGLQVDVVFVDRARKGMRAYFGLGRKIRARAAELRSDIVHVMYGGVMADEVTRNIQDRPTVVSFCGSDLFGEQLSGTLRKLVAQYGVIASRRAAMRATGIVVKSKALFDALPRGLDRARVRIIPNGVDLDRFRPLKREQCRDRLKWGDDSFHVLFPATSGDPCKRPELAQAAVDALSHRGIRVTMHHLRGIPHDEVPLWLNGSDVLLLTSLHEGSPNVVKEALACDLPVVSVDVGDVRERLQGIEGCYVANPVPNDLAACLSLVYRGKRRIAGRAVMQELSLERTAIKLRTLYEELCCSRPRVIAA